MTKKTTKAKLDEQLMKPVNSVLDDIKAIGTDIGEEPSQRPPDIHITAEMDTPQWLANLMSITAHTIALVESNLNKVLVGEFGTMLDNKRALRIIIEEVK